jgi:hypothetical protein
MCNKNKGYKLGKHEKKEEKLLKLKLTPNEKKVN